MAIPYQTAKFKSTNIQFFALAIWGPTTKLDYCQYIQLYGMLLIMYIWSSMSDTLFPSLLKVRVTAAGHARVSRVNMHSSHFLILWS